MIPSWLTTLVTVMRTAGGAAGWAATGAANTKIAASPTNEPNTLTTALLLRVDAKVRLGEARRERRCGKGQENTRVGANTLWRSVNGAIGGPDGCLRSANGGSDVQDDRPYPMSCGLIQLGSQPASRTAPTFRLLTGACAPPLSINTILRSVRFIPTTASRATHHDL